MQQVILSGGEIASAKVILSDTIIVLAKVLITIDQEKWSFCFNPCMLLRMGNYVANDPTGSRIPIPGPGRDAIWSDPAEMYGAGLEYFQLKDAKKERYTVAGLALHLGLSYWSLNDYQKNPAFTPTVQRLKGFILEQGEKALFDKDTANGAKYHLSVLGMKDTQQIEVVSKNTNLNIGTDPKTLESLTDEQLGKLSEAIALIANRGADRGGDPTPEAIEDQNPVSGDGALSP